jgi:hypothetical protein
VLRRCSLLAVIALTGSTLACRSPDPPVKGDPAPSKLTKKTSSPEPEPEPKPPLDPSKMRVVLDPPLVRVRGNDLTLGMKVDDLKKAIGNPAKSIDYGANEGAMTDTTYLSYADLGMSVRTKKGKVEGFYIYFEALDLEGVSFEAAQPLLPKDLRVDSTIDDVVAALGEPTRREPVASMQWMDLQYARKGASFKFHFAKDVFRSVSLDLPALSAP